eukprot:m.106755 g.106755  ORF g.106755 m.106755 type:complete len:397 (+) comp9193_c0_seq1:3080-4270(+)
MHRRGHGCCETAWKFGRVHFFESPAIAMSTTVLFVGAVIEKEGYFIYQADVDRIKEAVSPACREESLPQPPSALPEGAKLEVPLYPLANLIKSLSMAELEEFVEAGLTGDQPHAQALLHEAKRQSRDLALPAASIICNQRLCHRAIARHTTLSTRPRGPSSAACKEPNSPSTCRRRCAFSMTRRGISQRDLFSTFWTRQSHWFLTELYGGSEPRAQMIWSQHARAHVKNAANEAGLKLDKDGKFAVRDPRTQVFVLATWDAALHAEAKAVLAAMPPVTVLGEVWSDSTIPPAVDLHDTGAVLAHSDEMRLERLCSVFVNEADCARVLALGALDSRTYIGEARALLFERLRSLSHDEFGDTASRLASLGVAEVAATKPLFAMVRHLDTVGQWGGRRR